MSLTAESFLDILRPHGNEAERAKIQRYLHTGPDTQVMGVRMKVTFDTARAFTQAPLSEVVRLLENSYYEARVGAVSVLDFKARRPDADRRALYDTYLDNHDRIDNWDLVDRAAPRVVGWYLLDKPRDPLYELAASPDRWRRRTAITATFFLIRNNEVDDALAISERLLADPEPLILKSVGTALRDVGKVDPERLSAFLTEHGDRMTRPTLRVARTHLDPAS
ncbi:DNA alkylation repair protein [Actinoplanes sp. DH11]|uniref:DNA alkylation repair protein n=1 Tax=Actinoplanes sp. DH11 TaxID=2857011 RepID=UPI001E52F101|nr:DNA alkylation repair protein [Actinoplanes sp. DH11]